jgi:hypothetical protein
MGLGWWQRSGLWNDWQDFGHDADEGPGNRPAFDSWGTGSRSDMVPIGVREGMFDWLVSLFRSHRAWEEIDRETQRLYEQGLSLVANHVLKDGARVGSKQLADFTRGFADAIYMKLLVVKKTDADGKRIKRERRERLRT